LINKYEAANAIAGVAAPGIYEALKNALTPPPAAAANATAPANATNTTATATPAAPATAALIEFDDEVVLQLNGVPVSVNPESMIIANSEAATPLGLVGMTLGPDEVSIVQKKAGKDIDDQDMKDSIVQFNQKMVELKKKFKI
jgi:hypothetical protein